MKYKLIVDKQSRTNPSADKREYEIDIEELRVKGDVYDSLVITVEETYIMRRLSLSEYQVLSVLNEPTKESLDDLNVQLFEGDNYIYLMDMTGNKFYAEYIVKNEFNELYVTNVQMNSAINQSARNVEISVNQKLTGYSTIEDTEEAKQDAINTSDGNTDNKLKNYSTTVEMEAAINVKADEINSEVRKKVNGSELATLIKQNVEAIQYAWNQISQYIQIEAIDGKASLVIYDGNNNKLLVLDLAGQQFYNGDTLVGTMGLAQRNNELGVTMNLREGGFMGWGIYDSNLDAYIDALSIDKNALKLGTALKTRGYKIYLNSGEDAWTVPFTTGIGLASKKPIILTDENYNTIAQFGTDYIYFHKPVSFRNLDVYDANLVSSEEIYYMETTSEGQYLCVDSKEHGRIAVVTTMSDGRLKENIEESHVSALEIIEKIKHRQYDWKATKKHEKLGYIAQELEEIDEALVIKVPQTDQEGNVIDELYQYNTNTIVKYLTKAVQELSEELKEQKKVDEFLLEKLNLREEYKKQNKTITKKKENIKQYEKEEIKRMLHRKTSRQHSIKLKEAKNG